MKQDKLISRLNQLELLAGLILKEATMLKQGLSDVVLDKPTRKGLSEAELLRIKIRGEKRRQPKHFRK
jgi:hypothetical protein